MNLLIALICSFTIDQYVELHMNNLDCLQCLESGRPGSENYISSEKGLEIYINEVKYEYEEMCL